MRSLILIGLVGAAACSHGDTGLALTLSAPNAPPGVDRIEVVMASPDAVTVENQRPGVTVRYYRQKSSAGVLDQLTALDGYSLRLEGRPGHGDEKFIPFVIAYAGSAPVAIGAVPDPNGKPLALVIPDSSRVEATVAMVPLRAVDPANGIASGQVAELHCSQSSSLERSGIVWHPPGDAELRLLFPDPAGDSGLDASSRPLDLDCDDYRADDGDCDDLSPKFHPEAAETCDGLDTNCDGAQYALKPCELTECGADAFQLCRDDGVVEPAMACLASPTCACRAGSTSCTRCSLHFVAESLTMAKPCSPGVRSISVGVCSVLAPCKVEVVRYADSEGWDVAVALAADLDFKQSVVTVTGQVLLRVKSELSSIQAGQGASVGGFYLVVLQNEKVVRSVGVDIALALAPTADCGTAAIPSTGAYTMECTLP